MRNLLAAAGLLLAACGVQVDPSANNHGFGFDYDLGSADGVRFRNDPALLPPLDQQSFDSNVVQAWHEMEACTGISSPGPLVVLVDMHQDEIERGLQDVGSGRAFFDGLIIVTPTAITDPYFYTGNPATGRTPGTSVLRHEMVHELEARAGMSYDDNFNHRSPLFIACSGLG